MTICQSPIIMIILNYIIWRKENGSISSRTVFTASIRENSLYFPPYVMHHSYGQENVPFKRLLVYFSKEEVDSVQLLKVLEKGTGVYKPDQREKQVVHRMLDDLLKEQDDPQAYHEDYIHTLLNMALLTIARNIQTPVKPEKRNRITDVISYIHQNYQGHIHRPAGPDVLCESLLPVQGVQAV